MVKQEKWYHKTGIIVLLLILFWPIGLVLTWINPKWSTKVKSAITAIIGSMALIGILIIFAAIAAFVNTVDKAINEKPRSSTTSPIKIQAWTDKSKNYKQTYKINGLRVTINNIRKATKESGLVMPSDENSEEIWVVVNLTVKNISNESKDYTDLSLPHQIIDSNGNEFSGDGDLLSNEEREEMKEPLFYEEIDKLHPGENVRLPSKQEVTGNIWFSVSGKSTGLKLQRSGLFGDKTIWTLKY